MKGDALARFLCCRMTEAVAADGVHSSRQDVAQVAPDEFDAGNGLEFVASGAAVVAILEAEGDRAPV